MTFRNENTATITATAGKGAKRSRMRMAVLGGVVLVLPVAGLVTANAASAASASTWNAVAQCESTGNWSIDSGNGFSGGLQFTPSTWAAYGGTAYAPSAAQVDTTGATTAGTPSAGTTTKSAPAQAPAAKQQSAPAQQQAPAKQTPQQKHAQAPATGGGYTVRSGDTLSEIAAAHGTTVAKLYAANAQTIGASADLILPGQVLSI